MSAYSMQSVAGAGSSSVKVSFAELRPNVDMPLDRSRSRSPSRSPSRSRSFISSDKSGAAAAAAVPGAVPSATSTSERPAIPPFQLLPDVDPTGQISKLLYGVRCNAAAGRRRMRAKVAHMKAKLARDNAASRPALLVDK